MLKRFLEWIGLKEKLHNIDNDPPLVKERDLWWISFGENIGSEMNGKSRLFSRFNNIPRLVGGAAANRRMYPHTSKHPIIVNQICGQHRTGVK